jgi:hypothetical protein
MEQNLSKSVLLGLVFADVICITAFDGGGVL